MKKLLFLLIILLSLFQGQSQTIITLGNGSTTNTTAGYPAPYGNWYFGAKHHILILASELNAEGMTAGDISSLAFNVAQANGIVLSGFTISMKNTSATSLNAFDVFETGLTTVYGPQSYSESSGWNTHTFSSPFFWDGSSNLLIETCFNNGSYTGNAVMYQTPTSFSSTSIVYQDVTNVCSNSSSSEASMNRPDIQLSWEQPNIPPITDFSASSTSSCSGNIQFFDQSSNSPTSWLWDFGDGNTSTQQNPIHTYTGSGTYTVTLTATNSFGSDDEIKTNYIAVNLSGSTPTAASCSPVTGDGSLGFGITNVTFNTLNVSSADASEGYADFTCDQTTVYAGHTYSISITHDAPTTHNCAAWIDFNNDGVLDNSTEIIISNSSALATTGDVTIPSNATLNTPLRMRIIADYDLNAMPTPCTDPGYGQAEDYTIIVEQDVSPPEVDFEADVTYTCDGVVNFSDLSTNIPFGWAWDFGDGGTSVQQNPTHTYSTSGTYDVQLTATNTFGNNSTTKTAYIEVVTTDNVLAPSCEPATLSNCCKYGIYGVTFNTINYPTADGSDSYQDYSCAYQTEVTQGNTYALTVRTGPDNPQDTKVWIDYNNDGSFDDATELVMTDLNGFDPTSNITVPTSGVTTNTPLRLRVSSDEVGNSLGSCDSPTRGQVEDYAIKVIPVGISEHFNSITEVFPNPAKDFLNIRSSNANIQSFEILNITGKIVESKFPHENSVQVDISHLNGGVYFVKVVDSFGNKSINKIVIE